MTEPTLYSPAIRQEGGRVRVEFAPGHPGADDPEYAEHRAHIARLALAYAPGDPVPHVPYTEQEDRLWTVIRKQLAEQHEKHASAGILAGLGALDLPWDHVPQLSDVSAAVSRQTGFNFTPVAGLAPARTFYGSLHEGTFMATQYIRHYSSPLFSPEPDMVHEIIGHGSALATQRFADLYQMVGNAIKILATESAIRLASAVFWFCLEYGVVVEHGEIKVFGASLLSSFGELGEYMTTVMLPLDAKVMGSCRYDVTHYQPTLFCAESLNAAEDFLSDFYSTIDDETPQRLGLA